MKVKGNKVKENKRVYVVCFDQRAPQPVLGPYPCIITAKGAYTFIVEGRGYRAELPFDTDLNTTGIVVLTALDEANKLVKALNQKVKK